MTEPTALDQYLIELVNRARANPTAEASRLGIDLNQGLSSGQISATSKQPLAFDPDLTEAAHGHAKWMLDTDTFSHTGAGGSSPGARMAAAGYEFTGSWRWGENISWRGTTGTPENTARSIELQHDALFKSAGHRANILNGNFRELGTGAESGQFNQYNALMVAEEFAKSGNSLFLTGVAYDDLNKNQFYTPGEGRGGIKVEATSTGTETPVTLTDVTGAAGGYEIMAAPGTYKVTFSGGSLAAPVVKTATVGSQNVKVDLIDPAKVTAPAATTAQVAGAEVKGAYGEAPATDLAGLIKSELHKLDFSALAKYLEDHANAPEAWVEAIQDSVETLKQSDTHTAGEDFAGLIKLLGVPHIDADDHYLNA